VNNRWDDKLNNKSRGKETKLAFIKVTAVSTVLIKVKPRLRKTKDKMA